jgi:plastocyanin
VTWATADGTLDPASSITDADGIGATRWTLGSTVGSQAASAEVAGATGSPVTFTATATASVPLPPQPPPSPPPPPPPPPPSTVQVTVGNIFFKSVRNGTMDPAVDTVAVNGMVKWTWTGTGSVRHSVESTGSPSFTSSAILTGNGQSYSFQFNQAGTYTYDCAVHGGSMTGRIVVN